MTSPTRSAVMTENVSLSVVVPAFDEVDRIGASVQRILAFLDSRPYRSELIVVLDGGRPGAAAAIAAVAGERGDVTVLDNGQNRGKGFSVRRGIGISTGEFVLFMDADLSLPVEDADRFLEVLRGGADLAIGSRALPQSATLGTQQPMRESLSRLFNLIVRRLVVSGVHDTQCGFKAFVGDRARSLFRVQRIDGFGFDVEVLRIACRHGYRIVEVPVSCSYHASSSVRKVRHGIAMLIDLTRIVIADWRGVYAELR